MTMTCIERLFYVIYYVYILKLKFIQNTISENIYDALPDQKEKTRP